MKRLLPLAATHTLISYTKILYSKTIFGKKIEVKIEAKCQLKVYTFPSKHVLYCYSNLHYTIFGISKTKTLYSLTKQIFTNWNWNQNWGGNWGLSFKVYFPPPFSFISLHLSANVNYQIWVKL